MNRGTAPVRDSVLVIEGNKITNVSRKGQVSYPANAWIIEADGKYVLPGLFDSQNSYSWYFGEGMLNHGITSTIDVGTTGETAVLIATRCSMRRPEVRGRLPLCPDSASTPMRTF